MKVTVTARHIDITEEMKDYALEKARRLERHHGHLRKIEVILDAEADRRFSAEMIAAAGRGRVLVCHSVDATAQAAYDSALDKMERQLTRIKEKASDRHARAGARDAGAPRRPEAAGADAADLWW